ncbi:exo-alpha-sialidase [Streptomyces sp. NPDC102462]|uniref:golvesin C-terminal-like domain-containing protein n=1 Tax=Streptomyces sp. NPDC102462 TaxID=3366178 RepID=UPI0038014462
MTRVLTRLACTAALALLLAVLPAPGSAQDAGTTTGHFTETTLWDSTHGTHVNYHVQGLAVLPHDRVLVFAEGRLTACDAGPHDIVMRRSTDGGRTFEASRVIVPAADGESWSNPTPVVDTKTRTVYLFVSSTTRDEGNTTCSADRSTIHVMRSADAGRTWSAPRDLTELFDANAYDWTLHGAGPGHGIQLDNGRLLVPVAHRRTIVGHTTAERMYGLAMLLSDDHGRTWQATAPVPVSPDYPVNESRVHQRADGTVVVNGRAAAGGTRYRITATSTDRGSTWSRPVLDGATREFVAIDAGLLRYGGGPDGDGPGRLLFSRPDASARENLTVSVSYDEGRSFRYHKVVHAGPSYYSDLARLSDGTVLLVYGRDGTSPAFPERIALARLDLAWLTGGRDRGGRGTGLTSRAYELAGRPGTTTAPGTAAETVADVNAQGGSVLRYAAQQPGDYVEIPFRTPRSGRFELSVRLQRAADRGLAEVSVDGTTLPAGRVDATLSSLQGYQVVSLGSDELSAGSHRIRFTLAGRGRGGGTVIAPDQLTLTRAVHPADPPRVIADDDSLFSFAQAGQWSRATGTDGFYGQSYRIHPAGDGSAVARWWPDVPEAGRYEVQVRYTADPNRASDAPYTVRAADGSQTTRVDQRSGGGQWVSLGTHRFDAGTGGGVELSDAADGYVVADAVRLIPAR